MKACFKCSAVKPLSAFYKHSKMADGHLNKCMECTKKDVGNNRKTKIEYYHAYDRVRYYDGGHRGVASEEAAARARAKWATSNPDKRKAHFAVRNALRDGKLVKPASCERCGVSGKQLHGHHKDYSKKLDVEWICPRCHGLEHRSFTEEESRAIIAKDV